MEISNTFEKIGSYHREIGLDCAEMGAVSLELEYHIMEMAIIVVSFAFQIARLMNRMSARPFKSVEGYIL